MAVYKSTRCYPFLNSVDIRTTQEVGSVDRPAQYLKCKVDTSNKNITGYRIRILDEANNQVFPVGETNYISPITELQTGNMADIYESNGINSGLNGTYLYIPFFQNSLSKKTESFNALYYEPHYQVEHIILDSALYTQFKGETATVSGADNYDNWVLVESGSSNIKYNWSDATPEDVTLNRVQLDGEVLLEGQLVLVAARTSNRITRGIYRVIRTETTESGRTLSQTELEYVEPAQSNLILITHGSTFHNTVWRTGASYSYINTNNYYLFSQLILSINEVVSTPVPNISISNALYKWEITLYQGKGTIHTSNTQASYITYDNLEEQEYDMTAASGTILGSTSSRIQLASTNPFGSTKPVLPGLKEGVLVLQGKYMALGGETDNNILSNNRFYIKSYDASYGHAYTLDGALEAGNIANYTKAQFFKYSNDPESILETDKVLYGCGYNMNFKYCDNSRPEVDIQDLDEFSTVGVNDRRYGLYLNELPSSLVSLIKEGDEILITGENSSSAFSNSCQNGVYQVYDPGNSNLPSGILWLKRAAGYDSWSKFLGKVIYCSTYFSSATTVVGQAVNLESLAGSGSYTLWDPDQAGADQTKGGGALFFANERPILLFGQEFDNNYTYDLRYDGGHIADHSAVSSLSVIDGVTVQEGFTVVHQSTSSATEPVVSIVQKIDGELYYIEQNSIANKLYYITQGQLHGKTMYKNMDVNADWSLYTATVLHNTDEYTFITPFLNIEPTMRLKFMQNRTTTLSNNTVTKSLNVIEVDKTTYCIRHDVLKNPLVSEVSVDNNTPYKYEIRTYFKSSDENPFYVCETPYLILYKNNQEYSTLTNLSLYQEYWTTVESQILQQFNVTSNHNTQAYLFRSYADGVSILDRAVKFSAKYIQFDGISWESYRWTLFNAQGEKLQDSGTRYDKSIAAVFYGLSNDNSLHGVNYYVVLEVEDEKKNQLFYLIKLEVRSGSETRSVSNFTAKFDCDNHAVRLDYLPFGTNSDNNKATIYRREYEVYERPGVKVYGHIYPDETDGTTLIFSDAESGETPSQYSTEVIYVDIDTNYYYKYNDIYQKLEMIDAVHIYKGEWELVALKTELKTLYDYNIVSGKKYQYLLYPNDTMSFDIDGSVYMADSNEQIFANSDSSYRVWSEDTTYENQGRMVDGTPVLSTQTGAPVVTTWDEWSICELIPDVSIEDTPSVKKAYKINKEQVWLFKYSLETGGQTQNISHKDIQTLGTYIKMGYGKLNYASGEVTALLGSEIVLGSDARYIERLKKSRLEPLSTNEKIKMLETWHDFIYSKNPKLLKDIKGQSWIVQVVSGSNTPKNFYIDQPDTITFQWKQIDDVKNTIIYSDAGQLQTESQAYGSISWDPMFKMGTTSNNTFTIMWQNWDGSLVSGVSTLPYGSVPTIPEDPTREADREYTYTFDKWEPAITRVTQNQIYTAVYTKTIQHYTVTWKNWDGTVLKTQQYDYGSTPRYPGATPYRRGYLFKGWTPNITIVEGDAVYEAEFVQDLLYILNLTALNGSWLEDTQGQEEPVVGPIENVLRYTQIEYIPEGVGGEYPCFYLPYDEETRHIYFVPYDGDLDPDYSYGYGYVTGPQELDGEDTTQQIDGYAIRTGKHLLITHLLSGTEPTPQPDSRVGGYWEDSQGSVTTSLSVNNGDTVACYVERDALCVVFTNWQLNSLPDSMLSYFIEHPEEIEGQHYRWSSDSGYSLISVRLFHDFSSGSEPISTRGSLTILGEITSGQENILYTYLDENEQ